MKITCVGGGPAGLYLSILLRLRDPGHDITVFEQNEASAVSGWGVTFGQNLLGQLYDQDKESADRIREAAFVWRSRVTHVHGIRLETATADVYSISRRGLLNILAARAQELGVRIEYGREVLSLSELPDADLIVAADGVNSRLRLAADSFKTHISECHNKYIWLGTDKIFEAFNFFFVPTSSGWIWAHAYGIDPESSTFIVECSPQTWAGLGFDSMSADEALPILENLFTEQLEGHRLIGQRADGSRARWVSFRTISNRRWHAGNIVLVGDSAHTAHFTVGLGTTLAFEDAVALAENLQLHDDLEGALQSYERRRQAALVPIMAEARCSAQWFENIPRYISLRPHQFTVLLYARRSPLVALLPPVVAYILRQAMARVSVLDRMRERLGPAAKSIYGRR